MNESELSNAIGRWLPGVKLTRPLSLRLRAYLTLIDRTFRQRNLSPSPSQLQVLGTLAAISEGSDEDRDPVAHRVMGLRIGHPEYSRSREGEREELCEFYGVKTLPWGSPHMAGRESELDAHIPADGGRGPYYDHAPAVAARYWIATRA